MPSFIDAYILAQLLLSLRMSLCTNFGIRDEAQDCFGLRECHPVCKSWVLGSMLPCTISYACLFTQPLHTSPSTYRFLSAAALDQLRCSSPPHIRLSSNHSPPCHATYTTRAHRSHSPADLPLLLNSAVHWVGHSDSWIARGEASVRGCGPICNTLK